MGLFHCLFMLLTMVPLGFCLREMSFSQSLAFFSAFRLLPTQQPQPVIGCRGVGWKPVCGQVLPPRLPSGRADGTGGLPPSNTGARCTFREHSISCEHPSLRKRELDLCLHVRVAVLEVAGEQLSAPHELPFPLSTACSSDRFIQSWLQTQFLNNVP